MADALIPALPLGRLRPGGHQPAQKRAADQGGSPGGQESAPHRITGLAAQTTPPTTAPIPRMTT